MQRAKTIFRLKPIQAQLLGIALIELSLLAILFLKLPQEFIMDIRQIITSFAPIVAIPISTIGLYMKHDQLEAARLKNVVPDGEWKLVNRAEKWKWDSSWDMFCAICAMAVTVVLLQFT